MFVVWNPIHRSSAAARTELERRAEASGFDLTVLATTAAEPGAAQARAALAAGADLVVAAGGDGTLRHVAGVLAGTGVPLGIVATGTANLFALNLGLRSGPRAAAIALGGTPRAYDLGWSRLRRGDAWGDEEPFLVVAGLGHDAATVAATDAAAKRRLRWLAYLAAGVHYLGAPPFAVTVAADGGPSYTVDAWCVLAGNCGRLPWGVRVFAGARPDDGVLDTLVARIDRPSRWVGAAAKGVLHLNRDVAALDYGRGRELSVRPAVRQPVHLDGDAVGDADEARWRVAASALLVNGRECP